MSLNLSSDEEEFDEWVNTTVEPNLSSSPAKKAKAASSAPVPVVPSNEESSASHSDDSDEDDYNGIEWEDAGQNMPNIDRKMPARAVQIDLGAAVHEQEQEKKSKKRKRKRLTRLSNRFLPTEMRELMIQLSRSHLLCLTSSLVTNSKKSNDPNTLAIVTSLVPPRFSLAHRPTIENLRLFSKEWLFSFLNDASKTRIQRLRRNRAQGAPTQRSGPTKPRSIASEKKTENSLIDYAGHLAMHYDENPQLFESSMEPTPRLKVLFALALVRSFHCKARLIQALEPVRPVLDVDHPLLQGLGDLFRQKGASMTTAEPEVTSKNIQLESNNEMTWIEILCTDVDSKTGFRWVALDPVRRLFDSPKAIAKHFKSPLAYAVGVEHKLDDGKFRLCDVTPRYAASWTAALKQRGVRVHRNGSVDEMDAWWTDTIRKLNNSQENRGGISVDDAMLVDESLEPEVELEVAEKEELLEEQEKIPTSKAAFRIHPKYVIPSVLGKTEVLAPDAHKRVCGVFKGQFVYKRSDVSTALPQRKWLYHHRKVKSSELCRPVKRVNARKKTTTNFKALNSYGVGSGNDGSEEQRQRDLQKGADPLSDGMQSLYAVWQTEEWSPPSVGPNDKIPVNEYRNIELSLLNPGLVHVDRPRLAAIAKKLGIQYAPCLIGFEGHGRNRTPTIRGIVVHEHNEAIIREASEEVHNHEVQVNDMNRRKKVLGRWRRLMMGLLTKDRLDREYGDKE